MSRSERVLVAMGRRELPTSTLGHAAALAGGGGEVVLACVLVVPMSQPLGANLERSVGEACAVLDAADRLRLPVRFDTRLVRARSFSEGVLDVLGEEPFDLLVLEKPATPGDGTGGQIEALLERASMTVVLVRPR